MMGKGRARNQKGGAAIEAALVLPLTILLIFGMIEFGLLLYNRQIITNASREGARAGIVLSTPRLTGPEIGSVVNTYCQNQLVTFGTHVPASTSATNAGTACVFGTDLTVRVTYDYDFLVLTNFGFGPVTLEAETVMRCE
jgi:Flp pilus assembly protein TadG